MKSPESPTPKDDQSLNLGLPPDERVTAQAVLDELEPLGELTDDFEFFIPVHGFVRFTKEELDIINHPAFQRLGEIYQLGQAHIVYRGATHKRLEHVLGTVHCAQEMIDAVASNHARVRRDKKTPDDNCKLSDKFTIDECAFIRLAALLHDIGHFACGHTLEDELEFLPKHDEEHRINLVLDHTEWPSGNAPKLRDVINKRYERFLSSAKVTPSEIVISIICKKAEVTKSKRGRIRFSICRDVVGNTICADILDYLHRDWLHIGKPRYFDKRLFQYMQIRERPEGGHEFVITLGTTNHPKTDGISLIVDILESRYQLAEAVLFHRTKCSAAAMLERAVQELHEAVKAMSGEPEKAAADWLKKLEVKMLHCSDSTVLDLLKDEAKKFKAEPVIKILNALCSRNIYRQVYTFPLGEKYMDGKRLQNIYSDGFSADNKVDRNTSVARMRRLELARSLEAEFKLPQGSVAIYCPAKGMNSKLAKVNLHIGGIIAPFNEFMASDGSLGGDHLKAQMARFEKLWRIHVCVDRGVWDDAKFATSQPFFERVVKELGLGITTNISCDMAAQQIAKDISAAKLPAFADYSLVAPGISLAARGEDIKLRYPTRAPMVRHYFTSGE